MQAVGKGLRPLAAGCTIAAALAFSVAAQEVDPDIPFAPQPTVVDEVPADTAPAGGLIDLSPPEPVTLEPPEALPSSGGSGAADVQSGTYGGGSSESIQVDILEALDVDSVGALGLLDGGYGPTLWQGATMSEVLDLVEALPAHALSPAVKSMVRRLLMSTAPPPEGGTTPGDFVAARLDRLLAMGDYDGVERLLSVTPGRDRDLRFVAVEAGLELLKADYPKACGKATTGTRESTEDFWQQLLVLCQALSGARAEAEFGLTLMNDTGAADPIYTQLLRGLLDEAQPVLDTAPGATPLHIAMFRLARAGLAEDAVARTAPPALIAIATSSHIDDAVAFAIARSLAEGGALAPDRLRQLFEEAAFDADALASPISASESFSGLQGLALLYQASRAQQVDSARAEAVSLALARAQGDDVYAVTAGAFLPIIRSIPARTDLAWFAEDAARTLIMAGETAVATGWVSILRSAAVLDAEASEALVRLTPLIHLSGLGQAALLDREFGEWWATVEGDPAGLRRAALFLTLMEALEPGATNELWAVFGGRAGARGGIGVDLALWHRLEQAAAVGAPGRPILLASVMLGGSYAEADPLVLAHIVRQFSRLELGGEARAIALEAAVAEGL